MDAAELMTAALHGPLAAHTLFDFDGVLCEEWYGEEPDLAPGDPLPQDTDFFRHLTAAATLHIPTRPVLGIVTGRLSRYSELGLAWLRRHDVVTLRGVWWCVLWRHSQRAAHPANERKGRVYYDTPEAALFIESRVKHAEVICKVSGKRVLCTEDNSIWEPA